MSLQDLIDEAKAFQDEHEDRLKRNKHPSDRHNDKKLYDYLSWGISFGEGYHTGREATNEQRQRVLSSVMYKTRTRLRIKRKKKKTSQENKTMASFSILATIAVRDDSTLENSGLSGAAGEAIAAALAKRTESQKAELGECLVELLETQDRGHSHRQTRIRELMEEIEELQAEQANVDRAFAYAQATNNYIPWSACLGKSARDLGLTAKEYKRLTVVPEDWQAVTPDSCTDGE